jgi:Ca-activated chloride channel family protein
MSRYLAIVTVLLFGAGSAPAHGLLIPVERTVPPLAMLNHQVQIAIEDQVAVTKVEQTFRNHTDRALEATYIFPVPKGASVRKFTMWVNGKEVPGELVEADKARQIYTDIVRRTQDPGLLEYMGNNLLRLRVFPVPAKGDQKLALSFTSVAPRDASLVEYVYPLKTDGKATRTLEKFSLEATIKSQHPIQNVYSPTHAIATTRPNDHEAQVRFEHDQALLDKDFQLFYAVGDHDVGMTLLTQRPITGENGFFLLLLSPRVEMSKSQVIPRDMVLVLDTSGSMRGVKMDQAKKALQYCLKNLGTQDRFGLINFATTVNKYKDGLVEANKEQLEQAGKWVDQLEATGGTAIDDALSAALQMRTSDAGRSFTMVFFTDGCPTIGETNPDKILKNASAKNTANTRIFTFGVGDDVNATLLDQLAEGTRAVSTYVRPAEDIEVKVSGLYGKISHPVLTNLQITAGNDVRLSEIYPPQLPDLFRGGQVVVLGRYSGKGHAALTLRGMVGMEAKEFVYEANLPEKTTEDKGFVEHLWARRKVGYLLDQIRANGEKKELVDETVALAKKYGIATPYTSYLIVPDAPVPVAGRARPDQNAAFFIPQSEVPPPALAAPYGAPGNAPQKVADFARQAQHTRGELAQNRERLEEQLYRRGAGQGGEKDKEGGKQLQDALAKKGAYDQARRALRLHEREKVQAGQLGVDLSVQTNNLRNQSRLEMTAQRQVNGRTCMEVGGVWIDDGFEAKMTTLTVKAMSDAYFRILEKHPEVKAVFQLGNHLVWIAPNGVALVIDTTDGKEKLTDAEIDQLFVAKK